MALSIVVNVSETSYLLHENGLPTALLTDADGATTCTVGVVGEEGLGMPSLHRLSERSPAQHGTTDRGFRLDARILALVLLINAQSYSLLDDARKRLLAIFRPRTTPLKLTYYRSNLDVREIQCHTVGDLQFAQVAPQGAWMRVGVKLQADTPLWYNPIQVAANLGTGGVGTGMAIPWLVPWKLGATALNQSRTITYANGDEAAFATRPRVLIGGPITSPVITNQTTGDTLDFTGTTISGGDAYTIDCEAGTVVDAAGANKIGALTTTSDLTTFSLEAHPDAPNGQNTITIAGTGVSSATNAYIIYYERFLGI